MASQEENLPHVTIYGDGACIGNPGKGGYGVVLLCGKLRREISGGYRLTTNNRMELLAAITGLEALKNRCRVSLYSDSTYVVKGIELGWAKKWKAKGWKRGRKPALNSDLWERLLSICDKHQVEFIWVKGHSGIPENERCDQLANKAAMQPKLPVDEGYEPSKSVFTLI